MTSFTKEQLVEILTKGYSQQQELYRKMLDEAKAQHKHCQEATFAQDEDLLLLTEIVSKRQEMMSQVDKQNQTLGKVKKQLADRLGIEEVKLSALRAALEQDAQATGESQFAPVQALGQVLDLVGNLLKEMNDLDRQSQELMNQKLNLVKKELDNIQAGKKAKQLYQNAYSRQADPIFLDKKK